MKHTKQMDMEFLEKIRLQFINNPHLDSAKLIKFCQDNYLSLQDFSSIMYHILSDFFCHGRSITHPVDNYQPDQLQSGTIVEMEHTANEMIAQKIARDHLAEIPDYYTRLAIMEHAAGVV